MATAYWDLENGSDINDGLTIATPKLTWAGVKTALGGSVSPADNIRIVGNQTIAEASSGSPGLNITFTQYSDIITVPTDLTDTGAHGYANGEGIVGPDGQVYLIKSENIAGGTITIYGGYVGATTTVASLNFLPAVDPGVNRIGNDDLSGGSGNDVIFDGGWYDSGGGTPAQATINSRIVPSFIRAAAGADFWVVSIDPEYVHLKNFLWGAVPAAVNNALLDIPSGVDGKHLQFTNIGTFGIGEVVHARSAEDWKFNRCSALATNGVLSSNAICEIQTESGAPGVNGLEVKDCVALDATVIGINLIGNTVTCYGLVAENLVQITKNAAYANSTAIQILGGRWRGLIIENVICRGGYSNGVTLLMDAIQIPLSTFVDTENYISSIDCLNTNGGFTAVSINQVEAFHIEELLIDLKVGATGKPLSIGLDKTDDDLTPVLISNVQLAQRGGSSAVIYWTGVGFVLIIDSGITSPAWTTDVDLLNLYALGGYVVKDAPGFLGFVETVGTVPGLYRYLSALVDPAALTVDEAGYMRQDDSLKVGLTPSLQTEVIDGAVAAVTVPMVQQVSTGLRQISAKLRKDVAYGAGNPKLRVTSYTWNSGVPQPVVQEVAMAGLADVWNTVSVVVTIEYDQIIKVELVNEGDAGGKAWVDELQGL